MSPVSTGASTQKNTPSPMAFAKWLSPSGEEPSSSIKVGSLTPEGKIWNSIFPQSLPDQTKERISTSMEEGLVDAKIAAAEARTDAKFATMQGDVRTGFAELAGKMDLILARIDGSNRETASLREEIKETKAAVRSENNSTRITMIVTAFGSVLAILGILAAMLAFGGDQLGRGVDWRDKVQSTVDQAIQQRTTPPSAPAQPPPAANTTPAPTANH